MTIRVNGEIISEQAIEYELGRLIKFYSEYMSAEQARKQMDILRKKAKEQAIGAKILIDEAERLGIEVLQAEIDDRFNEMVKNAGGEDKFQSLLKDRNMTEDMIRDSIMRGRHVDKLSRK